ncbi:hypothetical protein [Peribacillus sp. B2I2]|uniref:hypothetical protein n=1 Tax=Peribacillus sp. B2I2 TaxID=3156468 RepID=UPI003513D46E
MVLDDFTKNILQCLGVGKNSYDFSILKIVMLTNMDLYLESVQTYKRELKNWQAGSKVDVAMICLILVPLMDKALEEPGNILMLHHYCRRLCIPSCHFNRIDRGDILHIK